MTASDQQEYFDEIEELMGAARRRVLHALLIVLGTLAAISSQIPYSGLFDARKLMAIGYWSFGCIVILILLVVWYRARVAATARLMDLVRAGECRIRRVERTNLVVWRLLPIGYEVDVDWVSAEHLAFGFWRENDAERLVMLLSELQANEDGPGADADVEQDD